MATETLAPVNTHVTEEQSFAEVIEREERLLAARNQVDLAIVKKTLSSLVELPNGTKADVETVLNAPEEVFNQALDSAIQVRREYYLGTTKVTQEYLQPMLDTERERAKAYRVIRDKAKSGAYNGSSGVMHGLSSFALGQYFSAASECHGLVRRHTESVSQPPQEVTVFSRTKAAF